MTAIEAVSPRLRLIEIISSAWIAQAVSALAELGVADELDEPATVAELAARLDVRADALERFLQAARSAGVLDEQDGQYSLTAVGRVLRSDAPDGMRRMCRLTAQPPFALTWAHADHTARTGGSAFVAANGRSLWEYLADPANAEFTRLFHGAMAESSAGRSVLVGYDLTSVEHVVDVGGGRGALLAEVLTAHPGLRGTVLDLPAAVEAAPDHLRSAGVSERVEVVAGSFFTDVPAGADMYVLARVIGNWDDERAVQILRAVRTAMKPTSRLLVVGHMPTAHDRTHYARALDLYMFVMLEARLRSPGQYAALFARAGLETVRVVTNPDAESLIEARPV